MTEFYRSGDTREISYWAGFWQRLRRLPLFYRVLLANITIIAVGAVFGSAISFRLWREVSTASTLALILLLTLVGVAISVLINIVVVNAALRPLKAMHRTVLAVQNGKLNARVPIDLTADPEMIRLARTFNASLDAIERDRQTLRELSNQVVRAQEEERRRISRELHDDTAQLLFAQILQVSVLKESDDPDVRAMAETLESSAVEALEGVRRLALELRPPELDDLGLDAALTELVKRFEAQSGVRSELQIKGQSPEITGDTELILYRIVQESLTNISKHAQARHAWVSLTKDPLSLIVGVRDDGNGFEVERPQGEEGGAVKLGLFGMQERAALIGGTLRIRSTPGAGTEITAIVPVRNAASV